MKEQKTKKNGFYVVLAVPGVLWLLLLFIVPFYAVLAIAMGKLDRLFESPVAVWNPFEWSSSNVINVARDLAGSTSFAGPIVIRTVVYVAIAALLSWFGISAVNWLGGKSVTVILGLVYGYIPYLILVLYAGLDRINPALIEAGRDLGLGRIRTFVSVTLPLSRQPILTALLITVLPMLGDYYTNQLMSGAASTSMIGNLIQGQLGTPGLQGQGAVLSLLLLLVLLIPMIYYVVSTNRSSQVAS